jgi:hypothetical protein
MYGVRRVWGRRRCDPDTISMIPSFAFVAPLATVVPFWLLTLFILIAAFFLWLSHWPGRALKEINFERASKFDPDLVPENLDTIVIGSGSGGCACANLLAQSGQRVLLLEQHDRTGGCTHTFRYKVSKKARVPMTFESLSWLTGLHAQECEWDTGLHYTSIGMSEKTQRPGALLQFMTKGTQKFTRLEDPYDQVVFPHDSNVKEGLPNSSKYSYVSGAESTVNSILADIDPRNETLKKKMGDWMELCCIINDGFTALGLSRVLPKFLHFLIQKRLDRLYTLASYSVRDVQFALFNLDYSIEQLLLDCPKAPPGPEPRSNTSTYQGCFDSSNW